MSRWVISGRFPPTHLISSLDYPPFPLRDPCISLILSFFSENSDGEHADTGGRQSQPWYVEPWFHFFSFWSAWVPRCRVVLFAARIPHLLVFGAASCSRWSRQPGVQEQVQLQTELPSSTAPSGSEDLNGREKQFLSLYTTPTLFNPNPPNTKELWGQTIEFVNLDEVHCVFIFINF